MKIQIKPRREISDYIKEHAKCFNIDNVLLDSGDYFHYQWLNYCGEVVEKYKTIFPVGTHPWAYTHIEPTGKELLHKWCFVRNSDDECWHTITRIARYEASVLRADTKMIYIDRIGVKWCQAKLVYQEDIKLPKRGEFI